MAEWLPPAQSADAALLPALRLGNARADDLVRNNGIAANAVALHKDHIVGHMFLISYRPNWRWLGMRETATKSFVDEVEAAWSEYAEGMFGEIDVEGKRTFTEFIREGVGVHAFNGEIFVQPVWDTESTQLFRTRFKAVSPKRVDTPGHGIGNRFLRAGVEVDRYGRAVAYHICEDDFPRSGSGRWERIPRELPTGRPAMLHIFEPVEDGQTRGANQFYSVMERLKMLDLCRQHSFSRPLSRRCMQRQLKVNWIPKRPLNISPVRRRGRRIIRLLIFWRSSPAGMTRIT